MSFLDFVKHKDMMNENVQWMNEAFKASQFGAWACEMTFSDFKYLGAKRYAEKDINTGKWDIKCCGLTDNIMKKVDNIDVFVFATEVSPHTP